jgi:DNA-binding CsgD family transcriptional regulator
VRNVDITDRDRRLLELLSKGLSNEEISKRLGYQHGSTRVYLHKLYRKLGVAGKTAAAMWYVETHASAATRVPAADESVGDMALRTDALTALGAMSLLIGPYGKLWHVAQRLKGHAPDPSTSENRQRGRTQWEALLRGDLSKLTALLVRGKHAGAHDTELLAAIQKAVKSNSPAALARVERIAANLEPFTPSRHIAMAALFNLYKACGNPAMASKTAEALWAEAEASRQHLKAMGEPAMSFDSAPEPSHRRRKDATTVR